MGNDFVEDYRGAPPESRTGPFRKALRLGGRPESRSRWYFILAKRYAAYLSGRSLHLASREDAEGFLTTLASLPEISAWQVEQATDAVTIFPGSVFGQEWARAIRIPGSRTPASGWEDILSARGLKPFQKELLREAAGSAQQEVRWHMAQMLPRLPLTRRQIPDVFSLLRSYLRDRSVIVQVCALQAMFELSLKGPSLHGPVRELVEASCRTGAPAMRARGRKLLTLIKEDPDGL
jgi:hypothetical protein